MTNTATNPIGELIEMHKYCRPGGSVHEALFSKRFIRPLKGVTQDSAGNWVGQIGANPKVLWSSHTDTVHRDPGFQFLAITPYDEKKPTDQYLFLASKEKTASCLGADCTVGVWLMRRMYMAKVPGLYIWHAEEETGGKGSAHIADKNPKLLTGIEAAIAFDRKGTTSVITHQWGGRCASDVFGRSLAQQLPGAYTLDKHGTFTDTANYADLVPECTNISVGYTGAHTRSESTNLTHATRLLEALLKFDASKLVISRKPGEREREVVVGGYVTSARSYGRNQYGSYGWGADDWRHEDWSGYRGYGKTKRTPLTASSVVKGQTGDVLDMTEAEHLEARFRANPKRAAELFLELGFSYDDLITWW